MSPDLLAEVWQRLLSTRSVSIETTAGHNPSMNGQGAAVVSVHLDGPEDLRFRERGEWEIGPDRKRMPFSNAWHWKRGPRALTLAHERRGKDLPVHLLQFDLENESQLHCSQPHVCGKDTYDAVLELVQRGLRITWKIRGPKKRDEIVYLYRFDPVR